MTAPETVAPSPGAAMLMVGPLLLTTMVMDFSATLPPLSLATTLSVSGPSCSGLTSSTPVSTSIFFSFSNVVATFDRPEVGSRNASDSISVSSSAFT